MDSLSQGASMTAAGVDAQLTRAVRRTQRHRTVTAIVLALPLLAFVIFNFVIPISIVLYKSVDNREVGRVLTRTDSVLNAWDGEGLPDDSAFVALGEDLRDAYALRTIYPAAKRLNSSLPGFQSVLLNTARKLEANAVLSRETLLTIDPRWGDALRWRIIKHSTGPFTLAYLLSAIDLTIDDRGSIVPVPEHLRAFISIWLRTLWMAVVVTGLCVALGYPVAYGLAKLPSGRANLVVILVLLPFWTAALVRTTAWLVLLQSQGVVNDLGVRLGLWAERLQLVHNRIGVFLTVTHVLLPFLVLPLYAVMKRIPPNYTIAAQSLGATPFRAFLRVYLPLTLHGLGTGALFVFILAVGFYVIPAIVGGPTDQMISYYIAYYASESLNWGAAAALSTLLLILQALIFLLFNSVFGITRLRMQ